MRRLRIALAGLIGVTTFVCGWAWGGVEGSKHDFSRKEWSGGDACQACHSPQRGEPPAAAPLWDQNADLNRTFGTPLSRSQAAGLGTVLCLRCHDGTIARDTIADTTRARFTNKEHPGLFSAGHGAGNHPVGVEYPGSNRAYRPAPSVIATGTVTLPNGNVECISCHDPHDMSGERHMLVTSNARSALCLTCHRK